ncbi:8285_t:CDS:2, partial [Entrophospora sp. SA101]
YEEYTYEELIDIAVEEVNDEVENIINENDKSGDTVKQLIRNSTYLKGHKLRLEFWGVIQCGVNIAPPKWCSKSNYEEIQHAYSGNLFGEPQIQQGLPNLGCSPHRDKHYAGIGETRVVSLNSSPTPAAPVFLG